jgi:uncharacterized protein (TIGR03067 family)
MVAVAAPVLAQTQAKPAAASAARNKTMALLQGSWVFVTADGQDLSGSGQEIVVTITDDKYTQMVNGVVAERGSFSIDDTKKPMWLNIKITEGDDAGATQVGVFEVTATTMRGKVSDPTVTVRPTDFEVADGYFVFTARKR